MRKKITIQVDDVKLRGFRYLITTVLDKNRAKRFLCFIIDIARLHTTAFNNVH